MSALAIIGASLLPAPLSLPAPLLGPPGKLAGLALRPLAGRPVLWHLIERVRCCRLVGAVVAALSVAPEDDALARVARWAGAEVFRGSLRDLTGRFAGCLDWLGLPDGHPVLLVACDTPLLDPHYLDAGLVALRGLPAGALEFDEDQAEEICPGLSAGFLRARALRLIDRRARTPAQRADAMSYAYLFPQEVGLEHAPLPEELGYLLGTHRLFLQTAEDLALHEAIYLRLYRGAPIDTRAALAFLDADPVLASINRGVLHGRPPSGSLPMLPAVDAGWRAR